MSDNPTDREFYVDEDLCTGCGDCIKAMPGHFRDTGQDTAEVITSVNTDSQKLEKTMTVCPGKAIKWK